MIQIKITRTVLFEKFDIKHEIQDFWLSQLDGCETHETKGICRRLPGYSHSIFFTKENNCFFEIDFQYSSFFCDTTNWNACLKKYALKYEQLQDIVFNVFKNQINFGFELSKNKIGWDSFTHVSFNGKNLEFYI